MREYKHVYDVVFRINASTGKLLMFFLSKAVFRSCLHLKVQQGKHAGARRRIYLQLPQTKKPFQ